LSFLIGHSRASHSLLLANPLPHYPDALESWTLFRLCYGGLSSSFLSAIPPPRGFRVLRFTEQSRFIFVFCTKPSTAQSVRFCSPGYQIPPSFVRCKYHSSQRFNRIGRPRLSTVVAYVNHVWCFTPTPRFQSPLAGSPLLQPQIPLAKPKSPRFMFFLRIRTEQRLFSHQDLPSRF